MKENDMLNEKFNDEVAKVIWNKIKGKDVPNGYTNQDKEDIITRYWHKAMESEQ